MSTARTDALDATRADWHRLAPDLDTEPMGTVGRILRIARLTTLMSDDLLAGHGLSRGEFDVLSAVRRAAGPLTPSQLARLLAASNASITKRLVALEAAGLARRERTNTDRRIVTVTATEEGVARVDRAIPGQLALERSLVDVLDGPERAGLEVVLRQVLLECESRIHAEPAV
ncbi:hypothetical protein B7R54_10855 [Subtercola boreus]|uniref:HTH marR-type domain-containing protein n=1 Tax=Subtercola boreus TaxID=120213 RepID=A0A3E0VI86_9MICO|nr:MarR family transcriptional regulator [Subtercola boreus]RFA09662.1 hypothetical protein B7R54_10855 [Subtercola boreus]TQL53255.1 DNA-binding MarR family transcriptional regulator [Subtercola boreus]